MSLAWFGCEAGASGDMFLGALVDAGAPLDVMQSAVDAIGVEHVGLRAREVTRAGLAAIQVEVRAPRSDVVRTWGNIRGLLENADLDEAVRARALDVFARLARAESVAHRVSPEQVHFHEVGALDAIADVVGSSAGLHALGVERAVASAVAVGSGMVRSEHGLLPVPAPAVLSVLAEADAPIHAGPVALEMCTPTGAALLAATVTAWGGLPPMRVIAHGSGAGSRDHGDVPNVLRLVLGEPADSDSAMVSALDSPTTTQALVLESNVDDLDPRLWPGVLGGLLDLGAADAWLTPILMKKGRPAHTLSVLCREDLADAARDRIFRDTSTLGIRHSRRGRVALDREFTEVSVGSGRVRVKVGSRDGVVLQVMPGFEDVAALAREQGRPERVILQEALAAAAGLR